MSEELKNKIVGAGLEIRDSQFKMLEIIKDSFGQDKNVLIEAATGTGKTLAYLLSTLTVSKEKDLGRIMIVTKTKILQDQLAKKDLPLAKKIWGEFNSAILYGSNEYLCLHAVDTFEENIPEEMNLIKKRHLECNGATLEDYMDIQLASIKLYELGRDPDTCKRKQCPRHAECMYYGSYELAKNAKVIVTNYHLLLTNISTGFKLFAPADILILDEGHAAEDICIEFWGEHMTYYGIRKLLLSFYNPRKRNRGIQYILKNKMPVQRNFSIVTQVYSEWSTHIEGFPDDQYNVPYSSIDQAFKVIEAYVEESCLGELMNIFTAALEIKPKGYNQSSETTPEIVYVLADKLLPILQELLYYLIRLSYTSHESNEEDLKGYAVKLGNALDTMTFFKQFTTNPELQNKFILWYETDENRKGYDWMKNVRVHASPLDISQYFRTYILENFKNVGMVSATLGSNGDFNYIKNMLGLQEAHSAMLESDFDYNTQCKLYLPYITSQKANSEEYLSECSTIIKHVIDKYNGRTLILTTSYKSLNYIYKQLKNQGAHIIKQGEMERNELLNYKRDIKESVLIGTNSLWEGIDIKGDALQSVVIVKLPFDVPTDPLIKARCKYLEERGYRPFMDFSVPRAIIRLKQGIGRLIRSKSDTGLITILDPRMTANTKSYIKKFINVLKGTYITDLNQIQGVNND